MLIFDNSAVGMRRSAGIAGCRARAVSSHAHQRDKIAALHIHPKGGGILAAKSSALIGLQSPPEAKPMGAANVSDGSFASF
jgi:hypothetical protein